MYANGIALNFSFIDGSQNSLGKFTNVFIMGAVDHDQKI